MSQPPPALVSPLLKTSRISYGVAVTDRPWELPVDAVAVSVGASLGGVGSAMKREFPDADWRFITLSSVTSDAPALLDLTEHTAPRGLRLRFVVLATPHGNGMRSSPTTEAITIATAAAISTAARAGATAIALPLFATGRLGVAPERAAAAVLEGALAAGTAVRTVVFFSRFEDHAEVIRDAWPAAVAHAKGPLDEAEAPVFSKDELAGGLTEDLVDPNECIPLDRDHLDVRPYVAMLATVIAAKDTPLPLSIGVFGEWGSGKSFFMGMLRGQVKELEDTPGRCSTIAQIGFNAWHYADSNLWASLGDEIFRQLAEPARGPGEPDDAHQERLRRGEWLRERLAAELEQRKQLTAVTERAETEAATLQRKIGEAERSRKLQAGRLVAALVRSPELRARYGGLWRQLGIGDAAGQGRLLAEELHGTLDEAAALRGMAKHRYGKAALAAAGVAVVAGVFLRAFLPDLEVLLTGAGAAFVGLAATGLTLLSSVRAGLRRLRLVAEDLRSGAEDIAPSEMRALCKAEADQRVAEAQLAEVVARIGELGRQLAELTPGRRLYAFLAERSTGEDYRGNLGLISTIRKDFEKLVALMTEPAGDDEARPVDRIVLYIDDLDRCSPQQVVDVLQAVHLLLAFDLFVVVVGVDPRWLLRSLSTHYDRLIEADAFAGADGWQVTPEDYLEKILNIPLVLPRMPTGSLQRLLRSIVEPTPAGFAPPDPAEQREEPAEPKPAEAQAGLVEPGSEVAARFVPLQHPVLPQPLTEPEIALLSRLDRLIDTPRDAKRLINLYRMLRATRDLSEASKFLGGEYEAVIVLLGTFAAHGRLLGRFADALLRRPPETPWSEFVADLRPVEAGDHWASRAVGRLSGFEVEQWEHLHHSLDELTGALTPADVAVFQTWVPRVRRFSYVLSPGAR
jgi:hypothetical protein